MKALTAAEMREVDRLTTERFGIPSLQLMENAGRRVADVAHNFSLQWRLDCPSRVAVLCGKGNNGGDGFVVARYLAEDQVRHEVRVYLFASPHELQGDCAKNFHRWKESGGAVTIVESGKSWEDVRAEVASAHIIVDALLGTGLRGGAATGLFAQVITGLNRISGNARLPTPALVLAVDTPSGLPSDGEAAGGPVLHAHETVTFTAPKSGQLISKDAPCCGHLHVKSIGSPSGLIEEVGKGKWRWVGPDEFAALPLVRASDAHKGAYGHVLVVAGSLGKSGAAALAGYGSLCAGAGLTTIASPDVVQPVIASAHSEYMTEPLVSTDAGTMALWNGSSGRLAEIMANKAVLAIGPGLGTHPETQKTIQQLVCDAALPMILDADGLNAFAGRAELLCERKSRFLAITPHPGEMARLLGASSSAVQADRLKVAVEAARRWNVYVILKGFHTVLTTPDGRAWINTMGGPELAKGGTGDVLTGVLAALTGQFGTEDWPRVLALGVYLHGAAGQTALGYQDPSGVLASNLAHAIPVARKALLQEIGFGA